MRFRISNKSQLFLRNKNVGKTQKSWVYLRFKAVYKWPCNRGPSISLTIWMNAHLTAYRPASLNGKNDWAVLLYSLACTKSRLFVVVAREGDRTSIFRRQKTRLFSQSQTDLWSQYFTTSQCLWPLLPTQAVRCNRLLIYTSTIFWDRSIPMTTFCREITIRSEREGESSHLNPDTEQGRKDGCFHILTR